MPGDIMNTLLSNNNTLVMEENERKEIEQNQLVGTSSTITTIRKDRTNKELRKEYIFKEQDEKVEKRKKDICNSLKELETLPLRTHILRAEFQEKIDQLLNVENKLTTTAFIEKPPSHYKGQSELRKQRFFSENPVDSPDDNRSTSGRNFAGYLNTSEGDSKIRPLIVRLPKSTKSDETDGSINLQNLQSKEQVKNQFVEENETVSENLTVDTKPDEDNAANDDDCLVNCLYYSQQCCECSIL